MPSRRRTPTLARRSRAGALLAGVVLFGAVGSCELPKPKLPSIGLLPGAGVAAVAGSARGTDPGATALAPGGRTR